jgi:transposase
LAGVKNGGITEDNGFVLYYKALAEECFKWPKPDDDVISLTGTQINWLLDGYDLALMKGHKTLHYESVFSQGSVLKAL